MTLKARIDDQIQAFGTLFTQKGTSSATSGIAEVNFVSAVPFATCNLVASTAMEEFETKPVVLPNTDIFIDSLKEQIRQANDDPIATRSIKEAQPLGRTIPAKSSVPMQPLPTQPKSHNRSKSEDPDLIEEAVRPILDDKHAQITPAHMLATAPTIAKQMLPYRVEINHLEKHDVQDETFKANVIAPSPLREVEVLLNETLPACGVVENGSQVITDRMAAFSPGERVVSGSSDKTVRNWNASDSQRHLGDNVSPEQGIVLESADRHLHQTIGLTKTLLTIGDTSVKSSIIPTYPPDSYPAPREETSSIFIDLPRVELIEVEPVLETEFEGPPGLSRRLAIKEEGVNTDDSIEDEIGLKLDSFDLTDSISQHATGLYDQPLVLTSRSAFPMSNTSNSASIYSATLECSLEGPTTYAPMQENALKLSPPFIWLEKFMTQEVPDTRATSKGVYALHTAAIATILHSIRSVIKDD